MMNRAAAPPHLGRLRRKVTPAQAPVQRGWGKRALMGVSALATAGAFIRVARVLLVGTLPQVAAMIGALVNPESGMEVYDPNCGDGRLLFATQRRVTATCPRTGDGWHGQLSLWGQERDLVAYLLMRLNALARGVTVHAARGDTMRRPAYVDEPGTAVRRFDRIVANPMWNQHLPGAVYRTDPYDRFVFGEPPEESADWGWVQHMHASLKDGGRMAVLLDIEVTTRGGPGSPEGEIRRVFIEGGLIEAVITCGGPFQAPWRLRGILARAMLPRGVLLMVTKQPRWAGQVLFIDCSSILDGYVRRGASQSASIDRVLQIYRERAVVPDTSAIKTPHELAARGYGLAPREWISNGSGTLSSFGR